jgi:hypothetical protein
MERLRAVVERARDNKGRGNQRFNVGCRPEQEVEAGTSVSVGVRY